MRTNKKANVWHGVGDCWYVDTSWWESPAPEPLTEEGTDYHGSGMSLGPFLSETDAIAAADAFLVESGAVAVTQKGKTQ